MTLNVTLVSYAIAALGFGVLSALLALGYRAHRAARALIIASMASMAWGVVLAGSSSGALWATALSGLVEAARNAAWFAFLLAMLAVLWASASPDEKSPKLRRSLIAVALAVIAATLIADYVALPRDGGALSQVRYATKLIAAIVGLVLVEQVYRATPPSNRWAMKFIAIALVGVFGFDLVLYADAMLYKVMGGSLWSARGVANALLVPLIAVSAARMRDWRFDIAVSRQAVFHSAALLGAGVYLLVVAAAGYYIRYFGGTWGAFAEALLLFGAVVLLVVMVASGSARARARLFLTKHFFSYRYDYREEWLKFTDRLSHGEAGPAFERRVIESIADLVDCGAGQLWLRGDAGDYVCKREWNYPHVTAQEPASGRFAQLLGTRDWVIDVNQWVREPAHYDALTCPTWLRELPDVHLVVPLNSHGALLGFVVLARPRVATTLNWEVTDILKTAGKQAASYLAQAAAAQALLQAQQFESFNRLSAFVVHDLKNLVAQLSLLLANARKHSDNPEFQADMLATVDNVAQRMRGLLMQLRDGTVPVEQARVVSLEQIARQVIADKPALRPAPALHVADGNAHARAHPERLRRVLGHLLQNAAEATPADGSIHVHLRRDGANCVIDVQDTGHGMSEDFVRDRLFQPFASTKAHGMGIGTFESREYIRELGGRLEVETAEGRGTRFRIVLPSIDAAAASMLA